MIAHSRTRAAALSLICAILYALLGASVSHSAPDGVDIAGRAVAGEAPAVAWVFTASCLWPTLLAFGIAGCVVAAFVPAWRFRIFFAIVTTLVTWQLSNGLKDVFLRPRPAYWIVHHESTYSYSSGHAMFAVIVYGLWAWYVARSSMPARLRGILATLLSLWGAGVIWSRLALGAHYVTDLIGGVLLAASALAAAATIASIAPQRFRGRTIGA